MQNTKSPTIQNLEAAFAGESMAHIKYMWFARQCRKVGDEATAKVFEDTARRRCCTPSATRTAVRRRDDDPAKCLQYAIEAKPRVHRDVSQVPPRGDAGRS